MFETFVGVPNVAKDKWWILAEVYSVVVINEPKKENDNQH